MQPIAALQRGVGIDVDQLQSGQIPCVAQFRQRFLQLLAQSALRARQQRQTRFCHQWPDSRLAPAAARLREKGPGALRVDGGTGDGAHGVGWHLTDGRDAYTLNHGGIRR